MAVGIYARRCKSSRMVRNGKLTDRRIRRACVQRIGRMSENRRKAMLRKKGVQRVRILPIKKA